MKTDNARSDTTRDAAAPFVVSVHDVAPATVAASRHWVAELDARGVRATLLVVPGPWRNPPLLADPELIEWLRGCAGRGHETSLHGFDHRGVAGGARWRQAVNLIAARGCGEFGALDEEAARIRLRLGLAVLDEAGIETTGFTPPGWLSSPGTRRALRSLGFRYLTSHLAVHDLAHGTAVRMPALSHRPGGAGERFGSRLMTTAARRWARTGRPFRIALHPADLERPALREAALAAIEEALAAGALATTYDALVRSGGAA